MTLSESTRRRSTVPQRDGAVGSAATDRAGEIRRLVEGVIGVSATEGNLIEVLRNGDEIFPAMVEAIDAAHRTIDFLTFIYWTGEVGTDFAGRLAARARDGVRVRILLDAWGAHAMDRSLITEMEEAGVKVRWFRPLRRFRIGDLNHRTHRKVLIVDEAVGFTGGVGIADEWRGDARDETEWRDTHFRIEGPAVDGLRAAFLGNWAETDPELYDERFDRFPIQPHPGSSIVQTVRGASETGWSDVATLYRALLQTARNTINITTAYFVPDDDLAKRLCDAADRGVAVRILLPGRHADKRFVQLAGEAKYDVLADHGVELWNFEPSMLHAKVLTVDGALASVGSANLNKRSMCCDEEINVVGIDPALVAILDRHFEEDLSRSAHLEPGRWRHRSTLQRVAEQAVRPIRRFF